MIRGPKCAVRGRVVAGAGRGWQAVQRGRGWPSFHAFFFIGARTSVLGPWLGLATVELAALNSLSPSVLQA